MSDIDFMEVIDLIKVMQAEREYRHTNKVWMAKAVSPNGEVQDLQIPYNNDILTSRIETLLDGLYARYEIGSVQNTSNDESETE